MSAGQRGLLAFWMGGASAPPVSVSAGRRSQLAPWIGGASAPPAEATTGGTRGLLAPWIGGASAPPSTGAQAGYRGLLGFWAGGYNAGPAIEPPATQPPSSYYGGGGVRGDEDLAGQVARGERGSGGWWGYVAPKPVDLLDPIEPRPEPSEAKPASAAPDAAPLEVTLTAEQAATFQQLLPSARTAEEVALLLAMVLNMPQSSLSVSIAAAPPPSDDELAMLALLLAAKQMH